MTTKLAIHKGTRERHGVSDVSLDAASQRVLVRSLDAGSGGLADAVTAAVDAANANHANFTKLPLESATAVRWGAKKAWVDLQYRRGRHANPVATGDSLWNVGEETGGGFHRAEML
ncbi:MAG: hypothetical protein ACLFVN_09770, partial [Phycisphaeraceae bacterium]